MLVTDAMAVWRYLGSAILSWWRHGQHRIRAKWAAFRLKLVRGQNPQETSRMRIALLTRVDPLVFEDLVLDTFQMRGCLVMRNTRYSGDGGLDGQVYIDGDWYGVQCKRYKGDIPLKFVLSFQQALIRAGLKRGFFVYTGRLTATAWRHMPPGVSPVSPYDLLGMMAAQF
jgi:restriction system protein